MAESDSRKELLARALLEYLELHPNEPVSVTSITRICGISRQLQTPCLKQMPKLLQTDSFCSVRLCATINPL